MQTKRILGIAVAMVVLLAASSYAIGEGESSETVGSEAPNVNLPPTLPVVKQQITMDMFLTVGNGCIDPPTSDAMVYLEKLSGIDFNIESVPKASGSQKTNLLHVVSSCLLSVR